MGAAEQRKGSPAPAGMDPSSIGSCGTAKGLPRTRGDGPWYEATGNGGWKAPPHPRGWTPGRRAWLSPRGGSPAPAGMDRNGQRRLHLDPWLPRTRGDGPTTLLSYVAKELAPPHPRGWTRARRLATGPYVGSPAPSGMDPCSGTDRLMSIRLPRTRGDGPHAPFSRSKCAPAPPHPRGWTRSCRSAEHRDGGSPAPAGMDPTRTRRSRARQGLPRTRGDGPVT